MTAAEAALEQNARDPFAELERTSAAAARTVDADPDAVYRMAGDIVIRTFRAKLGRPRSFTFLCPSCGVPLPDNRVACSRCWPDPDSGGGG